MRISAKADYAMRAALELAAAEHPPLKRDQIASAQGIPVKFLETILGELKHAGIVASQRGRRRRLLAGPLPEEVTLADVLRVMEGPLAQRSRSAPRVALLRRGSAEMLQEVWVALRSNMRAVLERVTLADVVRHDLPAEITCAGRRPRRLEPTPEGVAKVLELD